MLNRYLIYVTISTFTAVRPSAIVWNPFSLLIDVEVLWNLTYKSRLVCVKSKKLCILNHPQTPGSHDSRRGQASYIKTHYSVLSHPKCGFQIVISISTPTVVTIWESTKPYLWSKKAIFNWAENYQKCFCTLFLSNS